MTMLVEMTKEYRTQNGKEVRLHAVNTSGPFPVHGAIRATDGYWFVYGWTAEGKGRIDLPTHEWDLVEAPAETNMTHEGEGITEGPDLDRAVAEAIGLRPKDFGYNPSIQDEPCAEYFRGADSGIVRGAVWFWNDSQFVTFRPSTDLNDAFRAAEMSGLFTVERDGPEVHLAKTIDGKWEILTVSICGGMDCLICEATPALAICAAILQLEALKRT